MGKAQNRQIADGRGTNTRSLKREQGYGTRKDKWEEDRRENSRGIHIQPMNLHQQQFLNSLLNDTISIGSGSAGTGKTYLACRFAAKELLAGNIQKIVITRPYVATAGRDIGFRPFSDLEKLRPFIQPMLNYLYEVLSIGMVEEQLVKPDGKIELAPLDAIRGRNFDNAIIIVDESSNLTIGEVQALTTRIGKNSRLVMIGDNAQTDTEDNGLAWFEKLVKKHIIPDVGVTKFDHDDIVRSEMVKQLVIAFEREGGYRS